MTSPVSPSQPHPDDAPPTLYDTRAISSILKRASELDTRPDDAPGLTLAELQRAAADVGIPPEAVAQAAIEWHQREQTLSTWWGGPVSVTQTRTLDVPMDDATWEAIVDEVRTAFQNVGQVRTWGHTREWIASGKQTHVTATERNGRTHLRVSWQEPSLPAAFYIPASVASIILLPIIFDSLALLSLEGVALYLALVGILLTVARWGLRRVMAHRERRLAGLIQSLERTIASASPALQATPEPLSTTTPPLTLDTDADPDTSSAPSAATRQRAR